MRKQFLAVLILLLLISSSCGSKGAKESARCLDVPEGKTANIESGLEVAGGGKLRAAQAVKSNSFQKLFFIAAEIQAEGSEGSNEIGIWASNSLNPHEGLMFSVNTYATSYSMFPDGCKGKAQICPWEDGAREAEGCTKHTLGAKKL